MKPITQSMVNKIIELFEEANALMYSSTVDAMGATPDLAWPDLPEESEDPWQTYSDMVHSCRDQIENMIHILQCHVDAAPDSTNIQDADIPVGGNETGTPVE